MANERNARDRTVSEPSRFTGAYSINAGDEPPRRRPGWLLPLLSLLGLLLLLGLLFAFLNRDGDKNKGGKAANNPATSAPPTAGPTAGPTTGGTGTGGTGAGTGTGVGQLLAGGQSVLPLSSGSNADDLSQYAGKEATAKGVLVQSVPADEGFWVGDSEADRVWVQLTGGTAESGYTVRRGDRINFAGGRVVPSGPGFATQVGVTAAEGATQLESQKQHIEVPKGNVKLSP